VYRTWTRDFREFSRSPVRSSGRTTDGSVHRITKLIALVLFLLTSQAFAQDSTTGTVRGTVVDARTGTPLGRVLVAVEGGPSAETSSDGAFLLEDVASGTVRIYVSAIGYGLAQRTLVLRPKENLALQIPLSEGAATYTETVNVTADRFRRSEPGVPAQHAIGGADLQNLRGVLADDALRAVQVLPGVATGDDFRSEFTVRGSDFGHLNFTVDGFATPFLLHMVRAVEERANTGSVTMINSDALEEVTLSNGSYAQRSGNRTGAELAFVMREGSRDRNAVRVAVSGTSASAVAEGPLGRSKRGSWLLSGRKSYLDLLIDRLSDEGLSFGFGDVQAKFRYDLTERQTASMTFIAGKSTLKETPQEPGDDELFIGNNASAIVIANWRRTLQKGTFSVGVFGATNSFDNHTILGTNLENGTNDQVAGRADVSLKLSRTVLVESGVLVEQVDERQQRNRLITSTTTSSVNDYHGHATRQGGYARARVSLGRLQVIPGARIDYWQLTNQTTYSPWLQTELALAAGLVVRAAGGLYQQFPDFDEVVGAFAGTGLRPERSIHTDVGIEQRLTPSTRLQLTFYKRKDDEVIRRPGADTRLEAGRLVRGSVTASYSNRLEGYARGVEFLLQRSSSTGLSGWVSYAYGRNRYEDQVTGEQYWGDLDQRHTLNAYGFYRVSRRFTVGAKYRMGTNFPIPGYYSQQGPQYFVSDRRNELRLPSYARLDLRADRTFDWSRKRLTVFVEVINLLNRENVRFNPPRVTTSTRQVTRLFDSLVPIVPSAGILIEF
jgi:hypothetical protein